MTRRPDPTDRREELSRDDRAASRRLMSASKVSAARRRDLTAAILRARET
jgi:hypothetical protein